MQSSACFTGRARARLSQKAVGVDPAVVSIAPHKVYGVAADWFDLGNLHLARLEDRAAQKRETESSGARNLVPLVVAECTGAPLSEQIEIV